jgi:hypothetical protein
LLPTSALSRIQRANALVGWHRADNKERRLRTSAARARFLARFRNGVDPGLPTAIRNQQIAEARSRYFSELAARRHALNGNKKATQGLESLVAREAAGASVSSP